MSSRHVSSLQSILFVALLAGCLLTATFQAGQLEAKTSPTISTETTAVTCTPNITVTNNNDDGAGSLRQALADVCTNGSVDFSTDMTIYLSSTLEITDEIMIDGTDHYITLSGDRFNDGTADVRIFIIESSAVVTLNQLTIISGTATSAGALRNYGDLTILNSALIGNEATGSLPEGRGGAIENQGTLTILNSTISGNSADNGGGIFNGAATLTMTHSTMANNTATNSGGGILVAGGPPPTNEKSYLYLRNSILANNNGDDCVLSAVSGEIIENIYNIIEDGTCNSGTAALSNYQSGDPALETLTSSNNRPPTHAIQDSSIAADQIPSGSFGCGEITIEDQRGVSRPQNGACEIGSYEIETDLCFVETTGDNTTDYTSMDASALQTAASAANENDTIKVAGTCAGVQETDGITQTLYISQSLTIQGGYDPLSWTAETDPASHPTILDAEENGRVVYMSGAFTVTLDSLIIQNGKIDITPSYLSNGGGIYVKNSFLTLENSVVQNNTATSSGGGIRSEQGTLTIDQSEILTNTTSGAGGGVSSYGVGTNTFLMTNSTVAGNTAGATVSGRSITPILVSPQFTGDCGGGLYVENEDGLIQNSTIRENQTNTTIGGGICLGYGDFSIEQSLITENFAGTQGGGIYVDEATLTMTNSTVISNSAINDGGIYIGTGETATIYHTTIASNTATLGGSDNLGVDGSDGQITLYGSIVTGSSSNCEATSGASIIDGGYNLESGTSCILTATGSISNTNPSLESLADNGGDTLTISLANGSPSLDIVPYGTNGCGTSVSTDQRGIGRPQDLACDLGAYEQESTNSCFVESTGDNGTDYVSTDASALQAAVSAASSGDTIKVAGTCAGVSHTSGFTQTVYIDTYLTIQGGYTTTNWTGDPNSDLYPATLDAQGNGRVAYIDTGSLEMRSMTANETTLSHLTIQNGQANDGTESNNGGGIFASGTFNLDHVIVQSSQASMMGGGIYADRSITIENSKIRNNTASSSGGGIALDGAYGTINNTIIESNTSSYKGGGIFKDGISWLIVTSSEVLSNTSANSGGGIFNEDEVFAFLSDPVDFTLTDSLIAGNKSGVTVDRALTNLETCGAGINVYASDTLIENTIIRDNEAETGNGGGGICHAEDGDHSLVIENSLIQDNTASGGQGGAIIAAGSFTLTNSTVTGNSALNDGGFYLDEGGSQQGVVRYSTVMSNSGLLGGSDNFGGGPSESSFYLYGSIVAGGDNNCDLTGGTIIDGGYNIDSGLTCAFTMTSSLSNTNPLLMPLADYGGERQSFALEDSSPARDQIPQGVFACGGEISDDQRGEARPQNSLCDIGAYELFVPSASLALSNTADLQMSWINSVGTCDYDIYETTTPYFTPSYASYMSATTPYDILARAGDSTTNYYYIVQATCNGVASNSETLGAFDFSLTPGD